MISIPLNNYVFFENIAMTSALFERVSLEDGVPNDHPLIKPGEPVALTGSNPTQRQGSNHLIFA